MSASWYLETGRRLFDWLARYQVEDQSVPAEVRGNEVTFCFRHPVEGEVSATHILDDRKAFLSHGIAFLVPDDFSERRNLEVYDAGGIFDPVDGFVPGDHYATTYFALMGALLFRRTGDGRFLDRSRKAMAFHFRTYPDRYRFSRWGFHWDFHNVALVETYSLLESSLPADEKRLWIRAMKEWKESTRSKVSNWIAMRAYTSLRRSQFLGRPVDAWRSRLRLGAVLRHWKPDGCFDDHKDMSRPIQYHAYVLALLHRLVLAGGRDSLKKYIVQGAKYLACFVDPDGDFNYVGRGQEQIFGYGAALYAFEAAKALDPEGDAQSCIDRIIRYMKPFEKDGHFPLVLNPRPDHEKFGWYDYHHGTVYNAFLGAWLLLALGLENRSVSPKAGFSPQHVLFPSTHTLVHGDAHVFFVITGGLPEYYAEAGITPQHVWFEKVGWVFSCPGGPSPQRFGKICRMEHAEKNALAPLVRHPDGKWDTPVGKTGVLRSKDDRSVEAEMDYRAFRIHRKIVFQDREIVFEDRFVFRISSILPELRFFNLPVNTDKFMAQFLQENQLAMLSKGGQVDCIVEDFDFPSCSMEELESLKTAKGSARLVSLRAMDYSSKQGEEKHIRFRLSVSRISSDGP